MESERSTLGDRHDICRVYFVGNAVNFSEAILRVAASEFSEIGFRRAASLSEVQELPDHVSSNILALIVDESLFEEFASAVPGVRLALPNALLAVAYRNPEPLRSLLSAKQNDRSLDRISYLPMNIQFDSWLSILRLILGGDGYISRELIIPPLETSPAHTSDTFGTTERQNESVISGNLTERETEVLALVAEGKQNKTIAHELGLSEHTVKLHIHHIIAKLGVGNRTEAAVWFFEHRGLLSGSYRK